MNRHFNAVMISFTLTLFMALLYFMSSSGSQSFAATSNNDISPQRSIMLETDYYDDYEKLKASPNTVIVYPIFTQSAYDWDGIHDFYMGRCDTCTSIQIHNFYEKRFASSGNGYAVLEFLGYDIIDDIELDKNPEILQQYEKVILLHNEFVTENEFYSITQHPNVIYLYPNAFVSKIDVDYSSNTISLLRGPGFPNDSVSSGFDWIYDNSASMQDWECAEWKFEKIENGYMLNCYPEQYIVKDAQELLKALKSL